MLILQGIKSLNSRVSPSQTFYQSIES